MSLNSFTFPSVFWYLSPRPLLLIWVTGRFQQTVPASVRWPTTREFSSNLDTPETHDEHVWWTSLCDLADVSYKTSLTQFNTERDVWTRCSQISVTKQADLGQSSISAAGHWPITVQVRPGPAPVNRQYKLLISGTYRAQTVRERTVSRRFVNFSLETRWCEAC